MRAPDKPVPAFTSPDWLYEIKFDGYRMQAFVDAGKVTLRYKGGGDVTSQFPEVRQALARVRGGPHVLDGEVCALDDRGCSNYDRFRMRASLRAAGQEVNIVFCCFDLLVHNGKDIMHLPLVQRKARLAKLLAGLPPKSLLYVKDLPARADLFSVVLQLKLEGFMAKRKDSPYTQGPTRSPDWRKVRRPGAVPPERFKRSQ